MSEASRTGGVGSLIEVFFETFLLDFKVWNLRFIKLLLSKSENLEKAQYTELLGVENYI